MYMEKGCADSLFSYLFSLNIQYMFMLSSENMVILYVVVKIKLKGVKNAKFS